MKTALKNKKRSKKRTKRNEVEDQSQAKTSNSWRSRKSAKTVAMYCTMVLVSTAAIYFLEHASLFNAFRTALVAAIGKTFAATWVAGIFD